MKRWEKEFIGIEFDIDYVIKLLKLGKGRFAEGDYDDCAEALSKVKDKLNLVYNEMVREMPAEEDDGTLAAFGGTEVHDGHFYHIKHDGHVYNIKEKGGPTYSFKGEYGQPLGPLVDESEDLAKEELREKYEYPLSWFAKQYKEPKKEPSPEYDHDKYISAGSAMYIGDCRQANVIQEESNKKIEVPDGQLSIGIDYNDLGYQTNPNWFVFPPDIKTSSKEETKKPKTKANKRK